MLGVYIILVSKGIRTLESIPAEFREEVKKAIEDKNTSDTSSEVTN